MMIQNVFRTRLPSKVRKRDLRKSIKAIEDDQNFVQFEVKGGSLGVIMRTCPDEKLILHAIEGIPSEILSGIS